MGERGLRALGAGHRLVQQHRLERGSADRAPVFAGAGALRVEQGAELQVDSADGAPDVEPGAQHPRAVPVRFHGRARGEASHYCGACEREVWHALLVREHERRHVVHCLACARRAEPTLAGFLCLEEHHVDELAQVYDAFTLHRPAPAAPPAPPSLVPIPD